MCVRVRGYYGLLRGAAAVKAEEHVGVRGAERAWETRGRRSERQVKQWLALC